MRNETRTALKIKFISSIIQPSSFVQCPVFKIKINKNFAGAIISLLQKMLRETLSFPGLEKLL